jgi:hypothetical protein
VVIALTLCLALFAISFLCLLDYAMYRAGESYRFDPGLTPFVSVGTFLLGIVALIEAVFG